MTLKQAIKELGGPSPAAKAIGVRRTTLLYWTTLKKVPSWRQSEIRQLIGIAKAAYLERAGK